MPGFGGLVTNIYARLGTTPNEIEEVARKRGQYDAVLDLLERRVRGGRLGVRAELAKSLRPKRDKPGALDTHQALIELSLNRDKAFRLVTTNFDRLFESAAKRVNFQFPRHAAPMLPIPKASKWDGLVYLHGLLGPRVDGASLQKLVVTSGDFGLAYLTERWVARFVTELFRNYVVCFVGYSINDPVLRYMMDALAADRMLGEDIPQAYALGDREPANEPVKKAEWEAKGVYPILYEVPAGTHDHSAMHRTIKAWAETYRDGTNGKEQVVTSYASARPSGSTRQDDFVGRMLWALAHQSGTPARRFAEFNPAPSLEWLEAFSENRYKHGDLLRFGVPPKNEVDVKLSFSLLRRPAPYDKAPLMGLALFGPSYSQWDNVMLQLARWLLRHVNDPALIIWLAQHGGAFHREWLSLVEDHIHRIARLEAENRIDELEEMRRNSPNSIPSPLMRKLWRLFQVGRVKSAWLRHDLYQWKNRIARDGETATLRLELRELLAPCVLLRKPTRWGAEELAGAPTKLRELVSWELALRSDDPASILRDSDNKKYSFRLAPLLADFQQLLLDALDLREELGEADSQADRSYWDLPSISPHWQNRSHQEWVLLIELLRDAWLEVYEESPQLAARIAVSWFGVRHPTFKRLAFFAASKPNCIDTSMWVSWLAAGDAWWLWAFDTRREVMRLLVLQSKNLKDRDRYELEKAILNGPPRNMYRADLVSDRWQEMREYAIWLLLAKVRFGGGRLGHAAEAVLVDAHLKGRGWTLHENEREEFAVWVSGSGDPDFESGLSIDHAPRSRQALVAWLRDERGRRDTFQEDTWRDVCGTRFFHALFALCDLAKDGFWPPARWSEALYVWSEANHVNRSWRFGAPLIERMPLEAMRKLAHSLAAFLSAASKASINQHQKILLHLCEAVLALSVSDDAGAQKGERRPSDPVAEAINHPVGMVAEALVHMWFARKPADNDLLPEDMKPIFSRLCGTDAKMFRHARVILCAHVIALYRVDRSWAAEMLLPLFDWQERPEEASSAWAGFMWSPRLYRPLLFALKPQLLATAGHYSELGDHKRQFSMFLTHAALAKLEGFETADFQPAFNVLPQEAIDEVAETLAQAVEGAGERSAEYWRNRGRRFWKDVWPKHHALGSERVSKSLARLCIATREEFESALELMIGWIGPVEYPHFIVSRIQESGLAERFPHSALRLLAAVVDVRAWATPHLRACLDAIVRRAPELKSDGLYRRLDEFLKMRGLD